MVVEGWVDAFHFAESFCFKFRAPFNHAMLLKQSLVPFIFIYRGDSDVGLISWSYMERAKRLVGPRVI